MQKGTHSTPSTQGFLAISEIRDGVVVTRDEGLRAVIAVSSTNFVLKSQDEQNAILARYQQFLNTIDFPIQILIQSRRLDIHGYLEKIKERSMQQTNELLRVQTEEYGEYINKLLEYGNIMNKMFYVVVPHSSGDPVKEGFMQKIKNIINPTQKIVGMQQHFAEQVAVINDRVARVEEGLASVGLRTMRLKTEELVELLFHSYNVSNSQGASVDIGEINYSHE